MANRHKADEQDPHADHAKKVTVEAIKYHTNAGKAYQIGDTYEVDESAVDNLVAQGMALRADRVEHAAKQREQDEERRKAASHPVEPMTIDTNKG